MGERRGRRIENGQRAGKILGRKARERESSLRSIEELLKKKRVGLDEERMGGKITCFKGARRQ